MTFCVVYVGDHEDPAFKLKGGDWAYNLPRTLVGGFPPAREHYNAPFRAWTKERGLKRFTPDYDSQAVFVTRAQILDYLDYVYGDGTTLLEWLKPQLDTVRKAVSALDGTRQYLLVTYCN